LSQYLSNIIVEDILPTAVEHEIALFNNIVNGARYGDDIPIARPRTMANSVNGDSTATSNGSDVSELNGTYSESESIISLNSQTRIPISCVDQSAALSKVNLAKSQLDVPHRTEFEPNRTELTLISRIYLKNQSRRTERLDRLLTQWRRHEDLKVNHV